MGEEDLGKEDGVRAVEGKIGERVTQKVTEGADLVNEDQSAHSRPSNRWSAMKTDIILDRRASIIAELSGMVHVEAGLPGPEP